MVVATYNVRSLRRGVPAVVEALGTRPDLLLLQECGSKRAVSALANALEMEFVSSHRPFHGVRNAVLWRAPWRRVGHAVRDLPRQGRALPRGFVVAHLRSLSGELAAVSAHLGLVPGERRHHARELTDRVMGVEGRLVVGVDLNEGPEGAAYRWIADRLFDTVSEDDERSVATFPSAAPSARIDFLFVGDRSGVRRTWVPATAAARRASDHLPVVAEIELEPLA